MPRSAAKKLSLATLKESQEGEENGKEDRQFVTALARGLDILRSFDASRVELGTMDLANLTGLPQPTVWRLCHTLVKCGFLTPSPSGDKLRIGTPVLGLGYAALSMIGFDEILRQEMQRLAIDFDSALSLATPDRLDMLIIQRARGNGILLVNLHVGSRLPIATSSSGWAYIASLAPAARQPLLKRLAAGHGKEWPQLQKNIAEAVHKFEETGYVINSGNYHRDINAVAVPIVQGNETLVINCGAPATILSVSKIKKEVAPRLLQFADIIRAAVAASQADGLPRLA